jgi:hypothetical protein
MWEGRLLTTLWAFTACYRDSFTLPSLQKCTISNAVLRNNQSVENNFEMYISPVSSAFYFRTKISISVCH